MDTELFKRQYNVDTTVERLARTLEVPRDSLGLVPAAKGLAYGTLIILDPSGRTIDFGSEARHVSASIHRILVMPKLVLIVEKEAIMRTLIDNFSSLPLGTLLITVIL